MSVELTAKTSIWLSDEALEAERAIVEHLDFAAARKQRFEIALLVFAQVLMAKTRGEETISLSSLNFKKLP